MKITDYLVGEHAMIQTLFEFTKAEVSKGANLSQFQMCIELLSKVLQDHARLEENLLYRKMNFGLNSNSALLVEEIVGHSDIMRALAMAQSQTEFSAAFKTVCRCEEMAREHFAKEEKEYFPMAESQLGNSLDQVTRIWTEKRHVLHPELVN